MPFVQRDASGQIVAVSQVPSDGMAAIGSDHPDLQGFLGELGEEARQISVTDQDFVRVFEDVVELLIGRGVILFTDLPQSAQEKMLHRQALRSNLPGSLNLLGDD